ncbi:TPA: hypothetical protein ACXP3W_002473 [Klebsiella quasipneumoniae subsp. quasipneumoniae]
MSTFVQYQGGDCSGLAKKARILANYALTDYEAIFAYGDTPEDFAMLALATTQIYRWEEAPPCG